MTLVSWTMGVTAWGFACALCVSLQAMLQCSAVAWLTVWYQHSLFTLVVGPHCLVLRRRKSSFANTLNTQNIALSVISRWRRPHTRKKGLWYYGKICSYRTYWNVIFFLLKNRSNVTPRIVIWYMLRQRHTMPYLCVLVDTSCSSAPNFGAMEKEKKKTWNAALVEQWKLQAINIQLRWPARGITYWSSNGGIRNASLETAHLHAQRKFDESPSRKPVKYVKPKV